MVELEKTVHLCVFTLTVSLVGDGVCTDNSNVHPNNQWYNFHALCELIQ